MHRCTCSPATRWKIWNTAGSNSRRVLKRPEGLTTADPLRAEKYYSAGLNFFSAAEQALLRALQRGEFNIHGLRRADLAKPVAMAPSKLSRQLARLRALGLIKKVAHTYRYYISRLGRAAIAAACSLTRFNIIPALAGVR